MTTPNDLRKLLNHHTPFFLYKDITHSPTYFITQLTKYKQVIVLIRTREHGGHWVALAFNPRERTVYYFSSFGTIPDQDKEEFLPKSTNTSLQQKTNMISHILKRYFMEENGYTIRFNQYQYQDPYDRTDESCGLWCVLFLNLGMGEENFNLFVRSNCAKTRQSYKEFIYGIGYRSGTLAGRR